MDPIKLFAEDSTYFRTKNATSLEIDAFHKDWQNYYSMPKKFGICGEFYMGSVGIEGELDLLIPPAKKTIDILGYSRDKNEWDWWGFLSCLTVPSNQYKTSMVISFKHESYFDRSQDIICHAEATAADYPSRLATHFSPNTSSIEDAWCELWKIFQNKFDAEAASDDFNKLLLNFNGSES